MKDDLKLNPYKIQMHQRLSNTSATDRVAMCRWFLEQIENSAEFIENVWFSDEAHFYMNGYINSKKYVFGEPTNLKKFLKRTSMI